LKHPYHILTKSLCACLFILGIPFAHAENDINAQDLSRDLKLSPPLAPDAKINSRIIADSTHEDIESVDAIPEESAPWFKVELLIFKQQVDTVGESFPDNTSFKHSGNLRTLDGYAYPDQNYHRAKALGIEYINEKPELKTVILSASDGTEIPQESTQEQSHQETETATLKEYQLEPIELLQGAKSKLQRRSDYEVILEAAWMQQTLSKEDMPTIHLVAGNWFDEHPELEVYFKVTKQRYLHAYADIFLNTYSLKTEQEINLSLVDSAIQEDEESLGVQPHHFQLFSLNIDETVLDTQKETTSSYVINEVYSIHEDRIMKHSKDYYYLDHPKFGALIKVTPQAKLEELRTEAAE
jgi:hypothetical protein